MKTQKTNGTQKVPVIWAYLLRAISFRRRIESINMAAFDLTHKNVIPIVFAEQDTKHSALKT